MEISRAIIRKLNSNGTVAVQIVQCMTPTKYYDSLPVLGATSADCSVNQTVLVYYPKDERPYVVIGSGGTKMLGVMSYAYDLCTYGVIFP